MGGGGALEEKPPENSRGLPQAERPRHPGLI